MNYWNAVKEAKTNNLHIEPHVIPLGMAWQTMGYTNVEVVRDINWYAVHEQTDLKLTYENIDWLKVQPAENQLEYLVEVLGYKGVLIVVTSTKQLDNRGRNCYAQHYAYLPDPNWNQVGAEIDKMIERVLASWREYKP